MSYLTDQCISILQNGGDTVTALECTALQLESHLSITDSALKVIFLIFCSTLVFLMQAGFAMVCSGSVRKKNVQNTMLKNLLDVCGSSISFYLLGYGFAFGGDPDKKSFIGTNKFFMMGMDDSANGLEYAYWFFQFTFAATAATIVAGTLAERCQMNAYLYYSVLLTGFVYPVIVHNVWSDSGFLSASTKNPLFGTGMVDFAGSGVVHLTGGITALIATWLLGPRKGRFFDDKGEKLSEPAIFAGHSKSLQMLGSLLLWFGWFGFNAGSAVTTDGPIPLQLISNAVVNTTLAGSTAGLVALFTNLFVQERLTGEPVFKLSCAMNGCLCGLASVTGSCGLIEPWAAIIIGFVAGLLFLLTTHLLTKYCIDDAVDAIPVHLSGGLWGVIATGLFATPEALALWQGVDSVSFSGAIYNDGALLGSQAVGALFIIGWTTCIMFPFFILLNYLGLFRSDSLEEAVGLDVSFHGYNPNNHAGNGLDTIQQRPGKYNIYDLTPRDDENDNGDGVDRFE